ncbi:hypothetical protein KQI63_09410 [bacterium]|nr:hypothetical protein [bacterium]
MIRIVICYVTLLLLPPLSFALDPNPTVTGARSMAMGGAWYAAGYGSEVVEGNPALLTRFQQTTFSIEGNRFNGSLSQEYHGGFFGDDVNTEARTDPHTLFSRVGLTVTRGGEGRRSSFGMQLRRPLTRSMPYVLDDGKGGPSLLVPALAFEPLKAVSIGGSYTYLFGTLRNDSNQNLPLFERSVWHRNPSETEYEGQSWIAGLSIDLARLHRSLPIQIGVRYQPEWDYRLMIREDDWHTVNNHGERVTREGEDFDIRVEMPERIGGGVAVTLFRRLTLTGDMEWYGWEGPQTFPTSSGPVELNDSLSSIAHTPTSWGNTDQTGWRAGFEYMLGSSKRALSLRGGYRKDATTGGARTGQLRFDDPHFEGLTDPEDIFGEVEWLFSWPSDEPYYSEAWSLGVGLLLGNTMLDIAWTSHTEVYRYLYETPDFGGAGVLETVERNEETRDIFLASFRIAF